MTPFFALAALTSAFLIFWVEPLFAKLVLPLLGGSPSVWNTSLMYFQTLLLLGYLYAHIGSRFLHPRPQFLLHVALLALCFFQLPLSLPSGWTPPESGNVIPWLIGVLTVSMGLPFFVLSATAPLLQRWLASLDEPVENPYVLYAASNAGSFLGLLAFPFLFEPSLRLRDQSRLWSMVFAAGVILILGCGALFWKRISAGPRSMAGNAPLTPPAGWRTRLRWVALAFVPSSLLLGVTTYLSTDVAATPLLWVIPLSLYLLTFVIVFSRAGPVVHRFAPGGHAALILTLAVVFFWQLSLDFQKSYALHLALFFFTALVLHGELAASRPAPARLTEFYLWMSFGGALGGAFTALVAPVVFESTRDYLAMIVIACFLRPSARALGKRRLMELRNAAVVLLPALILYVAYEKDYGARAILGVPAFWMISGGIAVVVLSLRKSAWRFALAIASIGIAGTLAHPKRPSIYADRSFFGIYRVGRAFGPAHILYHGTTIHGAQFTGSRRLTPTTYYHANGPVGDVFRALQLSRSTLRVGVVGLGTGSILCYSRPGEEWAFFEIDPQVELIARNPRLFTFLSECAIKPRVVLGDARLTLGREPAGAYSLIVLDAFTSDAIPVHLLTKEAFALYQHVLADDGLLLVHISNRRLELEPVVGDLAEDARVPALVRNYDVPSARQDSTYDYGSDWVVIAKDAEQLAPFTSRQGWRRVVTSSRRRPWTDDYSNILSVIQW